MIRQTAALWSPVQLPPSNWRCPARRSEASRRPSMTLERSASEQIPSGQVTLDWTFRYPRLLWKWLHRSEMAGPARDSLIRVNISLIGRFNSLLDRIKFPVRIRRELPSKALILFPEFKPLAGLGGLPRTKFLVYFPASREFGFRDEFAQDCLLQRRVRCKPAPIGEHATEVMPSYSMADTMTRLR